MPTAMLLVFLLMSFFMGNSYSAPNGFYDTEHDDSKCAINAEDSIGEKETADLIPWHEEGVTTDDAAKEHASIAVADKEQRSPDSDDYDEEDYDSKQGVSQVLKELKRASSKVASALEKASQSLKRGNDDMVRAALEEEIADAKIHLKRADKETRNVLDFTSNGNTRGSAVAMAMASDDKEEKDKSKKRFQSPENFGKIDNSNLFSDKLQPPKMTADDEEDTLFRSLTYDENEEETIQPLTQPNFLTLLQAQKEVLMKAIITGMNCAFKYLNERVKSEMYSQLQAKKASKTETNEMGPDDKTSVEESAPNLAVGSRSNLFKNDDKESLTDILSTMTNFIVYLSKQLKQVTTKSM